MLALKSQPATVSFLILTWRLNGLGGERQCRDRIYDLEKAGLLITGKALRLDRREKSVELTDAGLNYLRHFEGTIHQAVAGSGSQQLLAATTL